jgi:predicted  nucleic acid-binding Zn-ribbon protein
METLLALQTLEFQTTRRSPEQEGRIQNLREKIPSQVLGHYDRLMARGKRGLAAVQNQVCSGCHMRVPLATVMTIMHATDIQLCGNCGRYLYLPEKKALGLTDLPPVTASAKPRTRQTRQKADLHVA